MCHRAAAHSASAAMPAAQVYVHAADAGWVTQPFPSLRQWTGDRMDLGPGLTVYRLGGHFPGSSVLLWDEQGRAPEGVLFTGIAATACHLLLGQVCVGPCRLDSAGVLGIQACAWDCDPTT